MSDKCPTCGGSGNTGGVSLGQYISIPCPDCKPTPDTGKPDGVDVAATVLLLEGLLCSDDAGERCIGEHLEAVIRELSRKAHSHARGEAVLRKIALCECRCSIRRHDGKCESCMARQSEDTDGDE